MNREDQFTVLDFLYVILLAYLGDNIRMDMSNKEKDPMLVLKESKIPLTLEGK